MTSHEPDEPRNDLREEVSLWKRREHREADVKIMYDTKSRCYKVVNGTLIKKECVNGSTKLKILSADSKFQFTVTRKRGGVYETDTRKNWIDFKKTNI